jgi:tetratricopeptide (TPR) repeat protein
MSTWKDMVTAFLKPAPPPQHSALREVLEEGRRAKLSEDYDAALAAFERAGTLLPKDDSVAETVIALQSAEAHLGAGRADEADALIRAALSTAASEAQKAYLHNALGMIAQHRGDWAAAREYYEQARAFGKAAGAAGAEGRAACHLADVYLHEGNASYAVHLLRESLPRLNTAGDLEWSCYFVGVLGQALIETGQESEGHHLLGRALQLAGGMNYRRYERKWSLALAERALKEGRFFDAETHVARALSLFGEAPSPSAEYVSTLLFASRNHLNLRNHQQAAHDAETALKAAQAIGDAGLIRRARGVYGVALRALNRVDEAVEHLKAAVEGEPSANQIDVLRGLAAAQLERGEDQAAIAAYERAIETARALHLRVEEAQAQRDLGLAYQRLNEPSKAIAAWTAALALYEDQNAYSQIARLRCDIGTARKALGQSQRALREYEEALVMLNSIDEHDLDTRGLVMSNAAVAYAEQGDAESADAFFSEAISIAEKLNDTAAESVRLGNYGWFLLSVGKPRRAISSLEKALKLSAQLHLPLHHAIQTDNLGLAYDALADYVPALEHHRKALDLIAPQNQPYWEALFRLHVGGTLLSLHDVGEAKACFEAARDYGRVQDHAELLARASTGLAQAALREGRIAEADALINEAITLARRGDLRRALADAFAVRSEILAAQEQPHEAASAWADAVRYYAMLHMPQAKIQPAWLTK